MRVTKELLKSVVEQLGSPDGRFPYEDVANVLTALVEPEKISYTIIFSGQLIEVATPEELIHVIEQHGRKGDHLDIYVRHGSGIYPETAVFIGRNQSCYKQSNLFLDVIEASGAGINLDKAINACVLKRDAAKDRSTNE